MRTDPARSFQIEPGELKELIREEVARQLVRVEWPRLLRAADIAVILSIDVTAARRRLSAGEFGAVIHIGRRVHVKRSAFVAALDRFESGPDALGMAMSSTGNLGSEAADVPAAERGGVIDGGVESGASGVFRHRTHPKRPGVRGGRQAGTIGGADQGVTL